MDNNMNNNYEYNGQQTAPEINNAPKKPVKRNSATLKVTAMILAIAIVGGGAGFGGAYIANKSSISAFTNENTSNADGNDNNGGDDSSSDDTKMTPTLNELQKDVTVAQKTADVEYNSDGTYMYTRDLVSAVQDSIVYIEVYTDYYGSETLYGTASGIIISSDGYIVTNNHVVEDCDTYTVKVNNTDESGNVESETYDATLLGTDEDTDLAVLKIDAENLPAAKLGDSDELHLGDDVVVIGNPLGYETSVSKGIISGLNRQVSDSVRGLSSIQTDAAINSGNSGGALFNAYGEVVGVVNEKRVDNYAESLGFAITINEAKGVIEDLITKGYVSGRSVIGIKYRNVSDSTSILRGLTPGWQVSEIDSSLPVGRSDLRVGDTITAVDGKSVLTGEASEVLVSKSPGETVELTVVREDAFGRTTELTITVELAEQRN